MTDRIYIQFADNGNIRKWQREPFEGGVAYLAAATAAVPADIAALVAELQSPVPGNPQVRYRAASALTELSASLAAAEKERDASVRAYEAEKEAADHYRTIAARKSNEKIVEFNRAEAAEASLAEARKALAAVERERDQWRDAAHLSACEAHSGLLEECEASLAEARKALAEKDAALEPFAVRAGMLDGKWLDHETHWSPAYGSTKITIGDLRAARRAHKGGADHG